VIAHPSSSGTAVNGRTTTDPRAVWLSAPSTKSQNRCGSRSSRPNGSHATRCASPPHPALRPEERAWSGIPQAASGLRPRPGRDRRTPDQHGHTGTRGRLPFRLAHMRRACGPGGMQGARSSSGLPAAQPAFSTMDELATAIRAEVTPGCSRGSRSRVTDFTG